MTLVGWVKRNKLEESPLYLKAMLLSIPLQTKRGRTVCSE